MAHFGINETTRTTTPGEWLGVGANIGQLVNDWSMRSDLVVMVGPDASEQAPALYNPISYEVEVNTDAAFGPFVTPDQIGDITLRSNQYSYPKATGAILHEALHARFSRWDIETAAKELPHNVHQALMLLEEGRIEALGVRVFPKNRVFLRASALEIAIADMSKLGEKTLNTQTSAQLAGLALARVDAGVLSAHDVQPVADALQVTLGDEVIAKLQSIWVRFQAHTDHTNALPLYDLAREWVAVVTEKSEESGEGQDGQDGQDGTPGGQGEPGQGGTSSSPSISEILEALAEAAENVAIDNQSEITDQQIAEEWAETVQEKANESKQQAENQSIASEVFGKGTGPQEGVKTSSRLVERRQPTSAERISAVTVAKLLDKARYRDRSETEIKSVLPPGRLSSRALVQGQALKSKGIMAQTEPWKRTARKHTEDPTLKVGVLVDISGSMGAAMEPMAVTAWVMSEATKRVQGKAAMVYFGSDVFPTLKPGQHLPDVQIYSAPDGTEKFDKAFKAIDGSLNLLGGSGARLLVVVSDGCFTGSETEAAKKWLKACERAGVAVVWLDYERYSYSDAIVRGTSASLVKIKGGKVTDAANEIGKKAAESLTRLGR